MTDKGLYNEFLGRVLPWANGEGLLQLSNEVKQYPPSTEELRRPRPVKHPRRENTTRSDRMTDLLSTEDLTEAAHKAYSAYRALDEELQRRNRVKYHIGDTVTFTVTGRVLSVRHTDGTALLEVEVEDATEEVYELWVRWDETAAVVDF